MTETTAAAAVDDPVQPPEAFQRKPGTLTTAQAIQRLADAQAALAGLLPQFAQALPQMTAQALAMVLQQVQVQTRQHYCCQCLVTRLNWEALYERQMKAAMECAAKAAQIPADDPRAAQLDITEFLPDQLKPGGSQGLPPLNVAVTTAGGQEVCPVHIPGRSGGRQLLVATGSLSPASMSALSS